MMSISNLITNPVVVAMFLFLPVGMLIEWLWTRPQDKTRKQSANLVYGAIAVLLEAAFTGVKLNIVYTVTNLVGAVGIYDLSLPFGGLLGSFASVVLLMFVADFFLYWMHRLQHEVPLLWQEHMVHHCDTAVDVTSTARLHPFTLIVRTILVSVPMAAFFHFSAPEHVLFSLLPLAWLYFIHLEIRLGFGKFWWLATSPQFHRIHHSIESKHAGKNYAAYFPLWDILFRSAHVPERNEYPEVGISGVVASRVSDMFTLPFKRWRLLLTKR